MAHITGGGIPENLPRCLPEGLKVEVDYDSWDRPEIFKTIAKAGDISEDEMRKVFNLGIGYCLIIPQDSYVDTGIKIWGHGMRSWVIGEVSSK
jgi:phosphoribosylformylglycinamidine cyclo-ligase